MDETERPGIELQQARKRPSVTTWLMAGIIVLMFLLMLLVFKLSLPAG